MKPFHTIAIPHRDILEGRLTMDVFAADLHDVSEGKGPEEYRDSETFFEKTYLTEGLKNLLSVVEKRLKGGGGDPVIQIQTPFGGGKTHSLIAIYHMSKQWKAKSVVMVGTSMSTKETLWGSLEKQLTGKIEKFSDKSWGLSKKEIKKLLQDKEPVIILMDEVLEYITKSAGVKIGESILSAQTMAFLQELTESVSSLSKTCMVITLPSSILEHYDESAEKLYTQLQKVAGRVEKLYIPVQDPEISKVIKRRLFSNIDKVATKKNVSQFIEYAERENILPAGIEKSQYRERFIDSYPFMPEVIDVLYHRWGSFPNFQRTRGVLRILALVIYSLKESERPYISLADFDLSNHEIRQELIRHIGSEFNGVISQDITSSDSGSKKVDSSLGEAYKGLKLGSRVATTIFLYSFSGGPEKGATLGEIKRCATSLENPSTVVSEAVEQLKGKLFYLQTIGDKYFFSNQPNLNRILLTKMENVKPEEVAKLEYEILKRNIKSSKFRFYIWEENTSNIADSEDLKLIIVKREDKDLMDNILKHKGSMRRININTIFFICPVETERVNFTNILKKKIAYENIERDNTLSLSEEQKKEINKELKKIEENLNDSIRRLYKIINLPDKSGLKSIDLGVPTYGEEKSLDQEVYEKLKAEGEIIEKIVPLVIKEKYLTNKDYILTSQIYKSSLTTPGEARFLNKSVIEKAISEGVEIGIYGLGEIVEDKPVCRYFKQYPSVALSDKEILISEKICHEQTKTTEVELESKDKEKITNEISRVGEEVPVHPEPSTTTISEVRESLLFRFIVPMGKVSDIMRIMSYLQNKFKTIEIEVIATDGKISNQEIEDKIKEAFRQLGIEIEIE